MEATEKCTCNVCMTNEFHKGLCIKCKKPVVKTIQQLEHERLIWAKKMFPEATALSSLKKLLEEVSEVEFELICCEHIENKKNLATEYADVLMCLFDSAGRAGISPDTIFSAFEKKLEVNKNRVWKKNSDNTYSHVKQP
jgi:phosphoribosyl-ATP pyrophosphohydrolase